MPIDSVPLPADGLDAAVWCAFLAATVFVLALGWALERTAAPLRPQPTLEADEAERVRRRL